MKSTRLKILVTGASGQLGVAINELRADYDLMDFVFASKSDLDITNSDALNKYIAALKPDAIINTAAYTAVDKAETNAEAAFLVNEKGVEHLALACKAHGIKLIHVSTDYVFDGMGRTPYKETDQVNPQTVYGKSKLAGETVLKEIAPEEYIIVRTSWLYSKKGHNFYNTMLRLARDGKEISVVNDQWGTPTNAIELAKALLKIVLKANAQNSGLYHYTGGGECTWYAFAKAILDIHHHNAYTLTPVTTSQYPTAAKRPTYSVLSKAKIAQEFGLEISDWRALI